MQELFLQWQEWIALLVPNIECRYVKRKISCTCWHLDCVMLQRCQMHECHHDARCSGSSCCTCCCHRPETISPPTSYQLFFSLRRLKLVGLGRWRNNYVALYLISSLTINVGKQGGKQRVEPLLYWGVRKSSEGVCVCFWSFVKKANFPPRKSTSLRNFVRVNTKKYPDKVTFK